MGADLDPADVQVGGALGEGELSDAELCALALAADPDEPLAPDAVELGSFLGQAATLLPSWYMAPVTRRRAKRWQVIVVAAIIAAFVGVDVAGLCSTYGLLSIA